jgi:hypothetical protein
MTCPNCWRSDRTAVERYAELNAAGFVERALCNSCAKARRRGGAILDWIETIGVEGAT